MREPTMSGYETWPPRSTVHLRAMASANPTDWAPVWAGLVRKLTASPWTGAPGGEAVDVEPTALRDCPTVAAWAPPPAVDATVLVVVLGFSGAPATASTEPATGPGGSVSTDGGSPPAPTRLVWGPDPVVAMAIPAAKRRAMAAARARVERGPADNRVVLASMRPPEALPRALRVGSRRPAGRLELVRPVRSPRRNSARSQPPARHQLEGAVP